MTVRYSAAALKERLKPDATEPIDRRGESRNDQLERVSHIERSRTRPLRT